MTGRGAAEVQGVPVVSIVIVHYRTPELLATCLEQIDAARVSRPHEVLVVDNAPSDAAAGELARRHGARYLRNERNVGYGPAVNQGMRAAAGRYFLILNPDVAVSRGSLETLVDYMEAHPAAGLCGPKLFSPDGSLQYSARTFYTLRIILLRRTFLGRLFPNARLLREHLMMDWDHNDVRDVDWMLGGALLVRRSAVDDVGGMDERFFLYFEDVDWCSRIQRRGWRVVYVPQATMVHAHQRASARGFLGLGQRRHLNSALRFYEKWSAVLYMLKRQSTALRTLGTVATDVVFLSLAFLAAYWTRDILGNLIPGWSTVKPVWSIKAYARYVVFGDFVAIWIFYFLGLYRGEIWRDRWRELFQLFKGVTIISLVVMASTFLFQSRRLSRFTILLYFPYALILLALAREGLRRMVAGVRGRRLHMKRLAVFAPRESIAKLTARFAQHGCFGYEPIYVPHEEDPGGRPPGYDPVERRIAMLADERVAEAAVFETATDSALVDRLLPRLLASGLPVIYVPRDELLLLAGRRVGEFMGFGVVTLGGRPRPVANWAKRFLDILAAVLLLVVGLPLHLCQLSVLGRGPLSRMRYVGRRGQVLELRAYRELRGPAKRIVPLRLYPALVNVLLGQASFVGLAPLTPGQFAAADEAYRLNPPDAPLGLFSEQGGLAGTRRAATGDELERLLLGNRAYVNGWHLAEDLRILHAVLQVDADQEGGEA